MNIILTSVGRRTYMIDYFREAMDGVGKVYASNSEYTYSLSHADGYVLTPLIYDETYISFLLSFCKKEKISAVISLFDIDLLVLAHNTSEFEKNGIKVIVSSEEVIRICNDKWLTYMFLKSNDISCPKTYISFEKVEKDVREKLISFPLIIKPRWGMGSIGISFVECEEELEVIYKKVVRTIFNSYLKYESNRTEKECVIFQEMIKGQEYGLDILNDFNAQNVCIVAKKKISMRAGETDIAETVDKNEFEGLAKKISTNLKHIGNLDVDMFRTEKGELKVLELNCRFGGQYPFSHLAGVNFPKQIIKWLLGMETDISLLRARLGVISCKDLVPVCFDKYN